MLALIKDWLWGYVKEMKKIDSKVTRIYHNSEFLSQILIFN